MRKVFFKNLVSILRNVLAICTMATLSYRKLSTGFLFNQEVVLFYWVEQVLNSGKVCSLLNNYCILGINSTKYCAIRIRSEVL